MKQLTWCILFLLFVFSPIKLFAQTYTIDFSTARKYVDSLNAIRADIGTPLPDISSGGTALMVINNSQGDSLFTVNIRGLDPEEERFDHLQLIVERNNLYVVGFVNLNTRTFYRFSDFPHTALPGVQIVTLSSDSSYTSLQRRSGTERVGMQINRHSLVTSYLDLMEFRGTSLTQPAARAILRFVSVTAEALRFRQIQRGFRAVLDDHGSRSYTMSAEDVELTLNWGRLSALLPDFHGENTVRAGRITLNGVNAILGAVALILNCQHHHHTHRTTRAPHGDAFPSMCPPPGQNRGIALNGTLWDSSTLGALLMRRPSAN